MVVVLVTAGATALGLGQLRALRAAPSPGVPRLLTALKRVPVSERPALAAREADPSTWEGQLARAVAEAPSELERTDVVSEAVGEIAGRYAARARWSAVAVRLEVLGGVLAAAWALIAGAHATAAAALIVTFFAAGSLAAVDRRAQEVERDQRRHVDSLVDLLIGPPAAAPLAPSPPKRGRR